MTPDQWKEQLENQVPYVPNTENYKRRKKLPKNLKFNPKDMLFKKELKASK